MPFVRIDLPAGRPPEFSASLGQSVQKALHTSLGVPLAEHFQVITEHPPGGVVVDPGYLGVDRSPSAVMIQVTLNRGRDPEKKKGFYMALVEELQSSLDIRREDVIVSLLEVGREDWSFGNGEAQLV